MSTYGVTYASTSAVRLDHLPPLAALQSWVHRPQAVAACFVSDVYALQSLRSSDSAISSRASRDVFLLNHFPCKLVELVGWVAGVEHKDTSMTVTLDDGDGAHVIQVVVRLAKVETKAPTKAAAAETATAPASTTFLTAKERKAMRKAAVAAEAALAAAQKSAPVVTYHRPDVRVGDTLRVVGRVDDWARRRSGKEEWVRQVFVDECSGSGSLSVVDADEQFRHAAKVVGLHQTIYSRPFIMPAPVPAVKTPPRASAHSAQPSPTKSTLSSIPSSDVYDDDFAPVLEPQLTDPAKLRSSLLTEATFKRYLMDHVSRETVRVLRLSACPPGQAVPILAELFPEYRHAVLPKPTEGSIREAFAPSHPRGGQHTRQWSLNGSPRFTTPDSDDDVVCLDATPKASKQSTFRTRTERQEALGRNRHNFAPSSVTRPWGYDSDEGSDNDAHDADAIMLEPFTVAALMQVERLRVLGTKVAEACARREERLRRQRANANASTARDERVVQDRISRGLRADHWRLTEQQSEHKLRRLAEWALREAAAEGGLVQVQCPVRRQSPSAFFGRDAEWSRPHIQTSTTGYLPLPPELVCPIILPLLEAERAYRVKSTSSMFLSRHDPRRSAGISVQCLTRRLRTWGEAGRWERAGEWAVEEALEWGVEQGLFYVCEGGYAVHTGRLSS